MRGMEYMGEGGRGRREGGRGWQNISQKEFFVVDLLHSNSLKMQGGTQKCYYTVVTTVSLQQKELK